MGVPAQPGSVAALSRLVREDHCVYPKSIAEKKSGCAAHDTSLLVFFLSLTSRVTREHRESLAKLAKQSTNKAKEALRKVRSKSVSQVKKFKNKVSEDTIWLLEKQVIFFFLPSAVS